ncbi:MAG: hypothetical protein ACP5P3_05245 [Ignavibacteria bacterium]
MREEKNSNYRVSKNIPAENNSFELYRFYVGQREGFNVWVVDGEFVRKNYFDEFVYGGNGERYTFIPADEIWIDNAISAVEFEYTLQHEINEFLLMRNFQMSYYEAHDSSLMLEQKLRRDDFLKCRKKEEVLEPVGTIDFDSVKEIPSLPDKIRLKNIYKAFVKKLDSIEVWIVDGGKIRRDIYPDFGYSGNDLAYSFIPHLEIWIDDAISCQQTEYSIQLELIERQKLYEKTSYDDAYEAGKKSLLPLLTRNDSLVRSKKLPEKKTPAFRDTGVSILVHQ